MATKRDITPNEDGEVGYNVDNCIVRYSYQNMDDLNDSENRDKFFIRLDIATRISYNMPNPNTTVEFDL